MFKQCYYDHENERFVFIFTENKLEFATYLPLTLLNQEPHESALRLDNIIKYEHLH